MNWLQGKFTARNLTKVIMNLVCLGGLLYQTQLLFTDFMNGSTVVSIRVGVQKYETLPSLTVCTDKFVSLSKALANDQNFRGDYQAKSQQLRKNFNKTGDQVKEELDQFLEKYYDIQEIFNQIVAYDVINNFSVVYPEVEFEIELTGSLMNGEEKSLMNSTQNLLKTTEYIESVHYFGSFRHHGALKCFTFFSWILPQWKEFKFNLNSISFNLKPTENWRPNIATVRHINFAIHSPNDIPNLSHDNFHHLNLDETAIIHFSQKNTELLGSGYDTDCWDYISGADESRSRMKQECGLSCLRSLYFNKCGKDIFRTLGSLFRKEWLQMYPKMKFMQHDECTAHIYTRMSYQCSRKCKNDCKFNYYEYDIKKSPRIWNDRNVPLVTIRHNNLPDISIKHIPQITFISFVCNFGGLLGMWLGLSFLTISDNIIKIIWKFVPSKIELKLFATVNNFKIENHY